MLTERLRKIKKEFSLNLKMKIILSLTSIAVVLFTSSVISVMEYSRMSTYVSALIADDVNSIHVAQALSEASYSYNIDILAVIGDEDINALPDFDQKAFVAHCDSLKKSLTSVTLVPLADSVMYAYSAYMLTSLELPGVILSDFIDSRTWYFDRLQPQYNRLRHSIDMMSTAIYNDLRKNSATFDRGFYRSIIPGIVAVSVGILLVFMLLFFILTYYVTPLSKMRDGLRDYLLVNKKYHYTFEGDDELREINDGISELTNENQLLRRRIKSLKVTLNKQGETSERQ